MLGLSTLLDISINPLKYPDGYQSHGHQRKDGDDWQPWLRSCYEMSWLSRRGSRIQLDETRAEYCDNQSSWEI